MIIIFIWASFRFFFFNNIKGGLFSHVKKSQMASQRGREIPCGNFSFALAEAWQYTINSLLFFEARNLKNSEMRFSNSKIKWVSLCFCLLLSLRIIQVSFLIFICTYMQNPYQSFYEISQKPLEFDIVVGSM